MSETEKIKDDLIASMAQQGLNRIQELKEMEESIGSLKKDKCDLLQHGVEQGIQISNHEYSVKKFIEWLEIEIKTIDELYFEPSNYERGYSGCFFTVLDKAKEMLCEKK